MVRFSLLVFRDFRVPTNMLISHYYSWNFITAWMAPLLPRNLMRWYQPFRVASALTHMQSTLWLGTNNLDDMIMQGNGTVGHGSDLASSLRLYAIGFVLCHSSYLWWTYGPCTVRDLKAFIDYAHAVYNRGTSFIYKAHIISLVFGVILIFCGETVYRCHWNHGVNDMDATWTSTQAAAGVLNFVKWWFLNILVLDYRKRLICSLLVTLASVVQWPFMWDTFAKAPLPFAHILAEAVLVTDSACLFSCWAQSLPHQGNKCKEEKPFVQELPASVEIMPKKLSRNQHPDLET